MDKIKMHPNMQSKEYDITKYDAFNEKNLEYISQFSKLTLRVMDEAMLMVHFMVKKKHYTLGEDAKKNFANFQFYNMTGLEDLIEDSQEYSDLHLAYNNFKYAHRYGKITKIRKYQNTATKLLTATKAFIQLPELRNYFYHVHYLFKMYSLMFSRESSEKYLNKQFFKPLAKNMIFRS